MEKPTKGETSRVMTNILCCRGAGDLNTLPSETGYMNARQRRQMADINSVIRTK